MLNTDTSQSLDKTFFLNRFIYIKNRDTIQTILID